MWLRSVVGECIGDLSLIEKHAWRERRLSGLANAFIRRADLLDPEPRYNPSPLVLPT
jgi:hypothetical protein